jgi:mono/diheme cytochrome c family protein
MMDLGMRKSIVIMAALAIGGSSLATAARAEQSSTTASQSSEPEASTSDIDGEQVFLNTCGFCHENGGRAAGRGPKLAHSARSDEFIIQRIKKGKLGSMPAFGSAFSDSQIIAILAYIRALDD